MTKSILDLTPAECQSLLFKQKSYTSIELPSYFSFKPILVFAYDQLKPNMMLTGGQIRAAKDLDTVNHVIYGNKDGKHAWRKFELIHPFVYVSLVNLITESTNWQTITARFKTLHSDPRISCVSMPVLAASPNSQKATQIGVWLDTVERESIRMALDFDFMFQTDVTDCYGALYTHSVVWALHDKSIAKANRGDKSLLGNRIDDHLQAMKNGQTNGIPQGSMVMDLIAEMVLAYADRDLLTRLDRQSNLGDFKIIRYRDDYRIFVNNTNDGDAVMKALNETLIDLGMRLSTSKTKHEAGFIIAALKPDKAALIDRVKPFIVTKARYRNELLSILKFSETHPNSGSIRTRLSYLYERLDNRPNLGSRAPYDSQQEEMLSILAQIATQNPGAINPIAAHMSAILQSLDPTAQNSVFDRILGKIRKLPNAGLLEICLQRIMLPCGIVRDLDEGLCKKIHDPTHQLFEIDWTLIKKADRNAFDKLSCINQSELEKVKRNPVVPKKEIRLFPHPYGY